MSRQVDKAEGEESKPVCFATSLVSLSTCLLVSLRTYPINSAAILPEARTPGRPAPGCVPAPTK